MKQLNFLILGIIIMFSCNTTKQQNTTISYTPDYTPGPPAIIYKTKKDYSKNVPVILSADKSEIAAYFGTTDLTYKGKLAFPTQLDDGFLLDNIGISENVAYTSLTIDAYTKSMKVFSVKELFELIIDDDPLEIMYNCGNRNKFTNEETELNQIINNKQLKSCKKLY